MDRGTRDLEDNEAMDRWLAEHRASLVVPLLKHCLQQAFPTRFLMRCARICDISYLLFFLYFYFYFLIYTLVLLVSRMNIDFPMLA